jgi:histidine triad (HIT) family protein
MSCIFCKIAKKESPAEIIYEDREILGFTSTHPEAPIHLLFIPKNHIEWQDEFSEDDLALFPKLISAAKKIALEQNIFPACKLIFNIGRTGHIPHIHIHLLGGWKKEIPTHNI